MRRWEAKSSRTPDFTCPSPFLGELYYGAYHTGHWEKQLARIRSFLPLVQSVHHDDEIAERYGQVKARLAALGSMIPENELWIAANCLAHDLTLASRDAHFESVEGLRLVRWE
jgi:tRNA(fMet)-specific endonuclease VapC